MKRLWYILIAFAVVVGILHLQTSFTYHQSCAVTSPWVMSPADRATNTYSTRHRSTSPPPQPSPLLVEVNNGGVGGGDNPLILPPVPTAVPLLGGQEKAGIVLRGVPTFKNRGELAGILQREEMLIGAELGVQRGLFAEHMLRNWPNCSKYVLVDLWQQQSKYNDIANVDNNAQEALYQETKQRLQPWKEKIVICRNFTTHCASAFSDASFDFVYVDARHDYDGALTDISQWWPKLKVGGILAGHDYVDDSDMANQQQDWNVGQQGVRKNSNLVRGAVDFFFSEPEHPRQVTVSYREREWNTWAVRK